MLVLFALLCGLAGTGLAIGGLFYWNERLRRRRTAELSSLALRLGFDVVEAEPLPPCDPRTPALGFDPIPVHGPDVLRYRRHLVRGSGAAVVRLGDTAALGDGGGEVTLATIEDPGFDWPVFAVRPRRAFGAPLTVLPVPIPEDAAFEAAFAVYSHDRGRVRAVLTPPVRAALLARGPLWYWEGSGRTLGVTDARRASPAEAEALLSGLEAVAQVVPRG